MKSKKMNVGAEIVWADHVGQSLIIMKAPMPMNDTVTDGYSAFLPSNLLAFSFRSPEAFMNVVNAFAAFSKSDEAQEVRALIALKDNNIKIV